MKTIGAVATIAFGLNVSPISAADSVPKLSAKAKPSIIKIVALAEYL
jgi:hypothetical protein